MRGIHFCHFCTYSSEESKVQYLVGLLRGRAQEWATALWEGSQVYLTSYALFVEEFKKVFDQSVQSLEGSSQLLPLKQGSRSVANYSIEFCELAVQSGWNDTALRGMFIKGLTEQLNLVPIPSKFS